MTTHKTQPSVFPTLRYNKADEAIAFLTSAFGLTEHALHRNPDGTVAHAELAWGSGIIMVGQRSPEPNVIDPGRTVIYLAVDDTDAHHEHARAHGAEIIRPLTNEPYGSREYVAADPEGNIWCFGTYRPAV